jgi:hypothetical protein
MKCPAREDVQQRAEKLAAMCGCRLAAVHFGVARAQLEIEAEKRK